MLRDPRTASRLHQAPAVLVRATGPHYGNRPDNGPRLRPLSDRFHGFDRRDSDRLADASRTGVDSLTFSHRMDAHSPSLGSYRTGGSWKKWHATEHTLAAQQVCATATTHDHQNHASCQRDTDNLQLPQSNYPNPMCAHVLYDPPQPALIERLEAA